MPKIQNHPVREIFIEMYGVFLQVIPLGIMTFTNCHVSHFIFQPTDREGDE